VEARFVELTYDQVAKWFDGYFEALDKYMGTLEKVPNLGRFFTPDFQFWMYTAPPHIKPPLSREEFLLVLVHPGLRDHMTPNYYVIDLKQMVTVAQIEVRFSDESSGAEVAAPIQASCHYHFVVDRNNDLKIRLVKYWTGSRPSGDPGPGEVWVKGKEQALTELALDWIGSRIEVREGW
jgi:hypothetical protein